MGFGAGSGGGTFTGGATTTPITAADGTKAAPTYSFSSDTNTGIYWRFADLISFAVGGLNNFDFFINGGTPLARIGGGGALVLASGELDATSPDVGIGRVAAGVARVSNGDNTGLGWFQTAGNSRVSGNVTNATATMAAITGLSATLVAGRKYAGTLSVIAKNSTAAEGLQFDFAGGAATFTNIEFMFTATPPGVTLGTTVSTVAGTAITASTATVTDIVYTIYFTCVCNAGGTLIPRFAEVTHTTGTATAVLGSSMVLTDIP